MIELVFLLEELSAEALLKGLLPRVLPAAVRFRCIVFEGKQDLEKNMERIMRCYLSPHARFIVLRDQDSGECKRIKQELLEKCRRAGHADALVRIACRELESWYLADLEAVEKSLGTKGISRQQDKSKYREPDHLESPSQVLRDLVPVYQKIGGSRAIGPHLNLENNRSTSFAAFIHGIRRLVEV